MIAWAETHRFKQVDDRRQVQFCVYDYDGQRQRLLADRGYEKLPTYGGTIRRLHFGQQPLAQPTQVEGYYLRTTSPEEDSHAQ